MSNQTKKISFNEFEKSFYEALEESNNIIFYSFLDYSIELSFSWDNFIISTHKSYKEIIDMYPHISEMDDGDISLNHKFPKTNPEIVKFIKQYTHNRGIWSDE